MRCVFLAAIIPEKLPPPKRKSSPSECATLFQIKAQTRVNPSVRIKVHCKYQNYMAAERERLARANRALSTRRVVASKELFARFDDTECADLRGKLYLCRGITRDLKLQMWKTRKYTVPGCCALCAPRCQYNFVIHRNLCARPSARANLGHRGARERGENVIDRDI